MVTRNGRVLLNSRQTHPTSPTIIKFPKRPSMQSRQRSNASRTNTITKPIRLDISRSRNWQRRTGSSLTPSYSFPPVLTQYHRTIHVQPQTQPQYRPPSAPSPLSTTPPVSPPTTLTSSPCFHHSPSNSPFQPHQPTFNPPTWTSPAPISSKQPPRLSSTSTPTPKPNWVLLFALNRQTQPHQRPPTKA